MKVTHPDVDRLMKYKVVVDAIMELSDEWDRFASQERTVKLPDGKMVVIRIVHP